jgi:N-methylhydantoinase B/oxoprolinase/acetone carboxylase alpha subunit
VIHRLGGEGVIRDIEFLSPIQCSILSERRVHRPYGLEGGTTGSVDDNTIVSLHRDSVFAADVNTALIASVRILVYEY